jgi:hypothetical protein
VWLCCALVLGMGLPRSLPPCAAAAAAAASATGGEDRGCCGTDHCCCGDQPVKQDCGCKAPPRQPLPEPQPRQPLAEARVEVQPLPQPVAPRDEALPPPARAAGVEVACVLLPRCTRQEALSVWRL